MARKNVFISLTKAEKTFAEFVTSLSLSHGFKCLKGNCNGVIFNWK